LSLARVVGVAVCAASASAIFLVACGGTSERLRALENDAFARYEPAGSHLVYTRAEKEGTALGERVYASYRRLFELPSGNPEHQLRAAVKAATRDGWKITGDPFRTGGTLSQAGEKRLASGHAEVGITVFPKGTPSGNARGPALLIVLRHFD